MRKVTISIEQTIRRLVECETETIEEPFEDGNDQEIPVCIEDICGSPEEIIKENNILTPIDTLDKVGNILIKIRDKGLYKNIDLGKSTLDRLIESCENLDLTDDLTDFVS